MSGCRWRWRSRATARPPATTAIAARIAELEGGRDRTGEVDPEELAASPLALTADPRQLAGHEIFIITVPTPVDAQKVPDLTAVIAACRAIGPALRPGAIVVLESTVYPGATEEVVGPALAASSGLRSGVDFFLGYSPERANPGDRQHSLERITKVVAGQTPEVAQRLAALYRKVTGDQVYLARDIRTAEAAKAIENAQRDINIAFVNEVAMICQRLGLSVHDVLDAARTKWNFLDFQPGLVGGHCIGVDPFYLAHKAKEVGHHPQIILAGRRVNDAMPAFVADRLAERLPHGAAILALGLTFKENVPDLRNSKAAELVLSARRPRLRAQRARSARRPGRGARALRPAAAAGGAGKRRLRRRARDGAAPRLCRPRRRRARASAARGWPARGPQGPLAPRAAAPALPPLDPLELELRRPRCRLTAHCGDRLCRSVRNDMDNDWRLDILASRSRAAHRQCGSRQIGGS